MSRLEELQARGFDESYIDQDGDPYIHVRCSQCQSCVVNGIALHERGCPHDRHECAGCNEMIPVRQKYCKDCQ